MFSTHSERCLTYPHHPTAVAIFGVAKVVTLTSLSPCLPPFWFMYAQFRAQYPMGSLISELLNIHEGKYIVRASIQVAGTTLCTGLSAASTIEQAEDQARVRALVVLGIEEQSYPTQAHLIDPKPKELNQYRHGQLTAAPQTSDFLPVGEASLPSHLEEEWDAPIQRPLSFAAPEQQALNWFDNALDAERTSPPTQNRPMHRERPSTAAPRPQNSFSAPTASAPPSYREPATPLNEPIDLSDIITYTDIELKRLGWTSTQGRRYLEQTYQKRSRQHLTDAELVEFLEYLKAQPSPSKLSS
ncbi:MAG TPA: hypothetical protein V6D19_23995 [Stenomitos sp.]